MLDKLTPTGADRMDMVPPPVQIGHSGQPVNLSYTEEVADSSPVSPILIPRNGSVCVLCIICKGVVLGINHEG
jgi:hypothetical protein